MQTMRFRMRILMCDVSSIMMITVVMAMMVMKVTNLASRVQRWSFIRGWAMEDDCLTIYDQVSASDPPLYSTKPNKTLQSRSLPLTTIFNSFSSAVSGCQWLPTISSKVATLITKCFQWNKMLQIQLLLSKKVAPPNNRKCCCEKYCKVLDRQLCEGVSGWPHPSHNHTAASAPVTSPVTSFFMIIVLIIMLIIRFIIRFIMFVSIFNF